MPAPTLAVATKIYHKRCDRQMLARYYLKNELSRLMQGSGAAVARSVDGLIPAQLWGLLLALSATYRLNDVAQYITDTGVDWYELELPVTAITLSGINHQVNAVTRSEKIKRSPLLFAAWLSHYFDRHPHDDPKGLNEFRPSGRAITHEVLMTRESATRGIVMLDGSHRLIELIQAGRSHVRAFAAVDNGQVHQPLLDGAIIRQLRKLYEQTPDTKHKTAILEVAAQLAHKHSNGRTLVQDYWAAYRTSGREVLKRLERQAVKS